jgi:predicted nucleotidyltransferase
LPGTKPLSWDLRTKRTKRMLKKNKDVFELIGKIPWVKLVGVTGSVAAYNTDKKSDVDIFVITTKNRMWLSRGFSVVFLKNILKRYPKKGKSAGQICPNIFIDEKNLEWPKKQQNIYTAHEIVMMQPIINKDDMYFKFIKANNWIHKYFPHFRVNCPKKFTPTHKENSKIVDLLEKAAMSMETKYMQKKKTKEITTKHMIHFKKYYNMDRILKKFKKKAKKAKK